MPEARLDDMALRILTSMFKHGLIDNPNEPGGAIDREANLAAAQRAAEAGCVLLKNDGLLPMENVRSIAVIGANADVGVVSGGGSSSVVPWGGYAREVKPQSDSPWAPFLRQRYFPSSPYEAVREAGRNAKVAFESGVDPAAAAQRAAESDIAIVFAEQWTTEFVDVPDLALPNEQEALIAAVAKANRNTIVVLTNGGPVAMPWLDDVRALLVAWYPGARGAEAISNILFGQTNPSGRLPLTFPENLSDTPNPDLPGADVAKGKFDAHYPEGADAGYRWFAKTKRTPLFPFGFGLTYTTFDYANLFVEGGDTIKVSFDVTNTGAREGAEVAQVYLTDAAGDETLRLLGWAKLALKPGETRRASVTADPRLLASYDVDARGWRIAAGQYAIAIGKSAGELLLRSAAPVSARLLPP